MALFSITAEKELRIILDFRVWHTYKKGLSTQVTAQSNLMPLTIMNTTEFAIKSI